MINFNLQKQLMQGSASDSQGYFIHIHTQPQVPIHPIFLEQHVTVTTLRMSG